eukprot:TRINITY_DN7229_c0_g1_i1.p1 TRINITY_DN7229_c0_g1~~TRINITY_DN7229_c0_g1_i1.p1  ORF type:complete len:143 (+),score=46.52 TRINITY_DN7229_c0_g1_i1:23-451(+)
MKNVKKADARHEREADEEARKEKEKEKEVVMLYRLCDQLVSQLSAVSDALERERVARIQAEVERDKLAVEHSAMLQACQQAGAQIEIDKNFIREALEHAATQQATIQRLSSTPTSQPQPADTSSRISRLAHLENIARLSRLT